MRSFTALIPARLDSKGIPRKNLKLLNGKPLLAHTIETAKKSKHIKRAVVITESSEIICTAMKWGAGILLQSKKLSSDSTKAIEVYQNAIKRLKLKEFVALLPTSPLRTAEDIDRAIELFVEKNADSVLSCCEHPVWINKLNENGTLNPCFGDGMDTRQEQKKLLIRDGSVFVFRAGQIKEGTYYGKKTYPIIIPRERSIDIDTLEDFEYAEWKIKKCITTEN